MCQLHVWASEFRKLSTIWLTPHIWVLFYKGTRPLPCSPDLWTLLLPPRKTTPPELDIFSFFEETLFPGALKTVRKMTSSTEVECRGLVQISKENVWHRQFQQELNLYPVDVFEDNTASITMASDLGTPHKRSKHFGIEWAYFKECVELAELTVVHVSTEEQPAFTYFRDKVMGGEKLQCHFEK